MAMVGKDDLIKGHQYTFSKTACPEVTITRYTINKNSVSVFSLNNFTSYAPDPTNTFSTTTDKNTEHLIEQTDVLGGRGIYTKSVDTTIYEIINNSSQQKKEKIIGYTAIFQDTINGYQYNVSVPYTKGKGTCKIFSEDIPLAAAVGGRRRRTKRRSTRKRSTKRRKSLRN